MELVKKTFATRVKDLVGKISEDNLLLLSSSISYYSALALAPFFLILLATASFLGQNIQKEIVEHAQMTLSPDVAVMVQIIFENVNEGVSLGSISGIIGVIVLLITASAVLVQFRYAFDVIYGYHDPNVPKTLLMTVKERLLSMLAVIGGAVLFIFTISLSRIFDHFFGVEGEKSFISQVMVIILNFLIYLGMFTAIHYLVPSKRPKLKFAVQISICSSLFFIIGNLLLASYLKGVAAGSIYGAAGTLLVFLTWANYSAFTVFLSVEVFLYLKKIGKIR